MADTSNTFNAARNLGSFPRSTIFRRLESVGRGDKSDFYRFTLTGRSSVSLTLDRIQLSPALQNGLTANVNLAFFNEQRQLLGTSRRAGTQREAIEPQQPLAAGTYVIRVFQSPGNTLGRTRYRLNIDATASNGGGGGDGTAPIVRSNGASLLSGTTLNINSSLLEATDQEQSAGELTYTLNATPQNGTLLRNGSVLSIGDKFTQADINAGLISYAQPSAAQIGSGSAPQLDGSNVVWSGRDPSGADSEIFFYSPATGTIQLTANDFDDTNPQISGSNVAWVGSDGNDTEIFLYNSNTKTISNISNNSFNDFDPQISGSNVAWVGSVDNADNEIFIYKQIGGSFQTRQLTNNNADDSAPQLSANSLAWYHLNQANPVNQQQEVWYHSVISPANSSGNLVIGNNQDSTTFNANGEIAGQQTDGASALQVSDVRLAWVTPDTSGNSQIYYYTGTGSVNQLTSDPTDKGFPQVSKTGSVFDTDITWVNFIDGNNEIFYAFTSGSSASVVTNRVTNNSLDDSAPQIIGSDVVWTRFDGIDYEIFFVRKSSGQPNDNSSTVALTNNNTNDKFLALSKSGSNSNVFWSGYNTTSGTYEVSYYDGNKTTQLTTNDGIENYSLQASGSNVVWTDQAAFGTSSNASIFYSNLATTDSFRFSVDDGTGRTATGSFSITIG